MYLNLQKLKLKELSFNILCIYSFFIYVGYINLFTKKLHSIFLYIFVILCFFKCLKEKKFKFTFYNKWYISFVIYLLFSSFYTQNENYKNELFSVIVIFVITWCFTQIIDSKSKIERFFNTLIMGSVVLLIFLFFNGDLVLNDDLAGRFGKKLTGNSNIFAYIYMISSIVTVYLLSIKKNKLLYGIALLIEFFALILAGGRKYFILPILMGGVIYFQQKDQLGRKNLLKKIILNILCGVIIVILLNKVPFLYEHIGIRIEEFINYIFFKKEMLDVGTIDRKLMIEKGIVLWKEHPIFGNGLSAFTAIGGFQRYSHNNYVELLCNEGIIGFILYYIFYIFCIYNLWKRFNSDEMIKFFLNFIVCMMLYEMMAINYDAILSQIFICLSWNFISILRRKKLKKAF